MSTDQRNVYYHALQRCVLLKSTDFNASIDVKVSSEIRTQLTADHLNFIMQFGLAMLNAFVIS